MVSGVRRFPDTENGGLLLGIKKENKIFIVEAIEAGIDSVREKGRLSFEGSSMEHTVTSIIDLYEEELSIIGIWHKHGHDHNPPFSAEDEMCHKALSNQLKHEIITILFQKKLNDEYVMRVFCYKNEKLSEEEFGISALEKMIHYKSYI